MLGLADKTALVDLFAHLLAGEPLPMLAAVAQQYSLGVEPLAILRALMELTHRIARAQLGGESAPEPGMAPLPPEWGQKLSQGQVHRLWQLLLKGYDEVKAAPDPLVAAEMALLRVLHAADMPDPGKLAAHLAHLAASAPAGAAAAATAVGGPAAQLGWEALVEQVEEAGALVAAQMMRDWVRVIRLDPRLLVYTLAPGLAHDPAPDIRDGLLRATGEKWQLEAGEGQAAPTLRETAEAARAEEAARMRAHPLVEAAFAAFPNAEFVTRSEPAQGRQGWNRRA
jgi:DNA polymerase-3 subunit gamma/tau